MDYVSSNFMAPSQRNTVISQLYSFDNIFVIKFVITSNGDMKKPPIQPYAPLFTPMHPYSPLYTTTLTIVIKQLVYVRTYVGLSDFV